MSVASTTEEAERRLPSAIPKSVRPPAGQRYKFQRARPSLASRPVRATAGSPVGLDLRRSAAKKQVTHSRRLAKELLTWPPTDPQNMLDPNTHPSVKSSPAGFPEPTCRGHAGGSAQPGPTGRNSHPDWSGLTFSMASFLFLFSFLKPEIHF